MEVQYTETAREVLRQARETAIERGYFRVNTGHIFNELMRLDSLGKRILDEICGPDRLKDMQVKYTRRTKKSDIPENSYSPKASFALHCAENLVDESMKVSTGHLLLGLIYEQHGEAHGLLERNNVYPDMIARKFDELLRNGASEL